MGESLKLKDIYLGIPDGETEARKENILELFFDSNGLYNSLNDNQDKFMIIGNKGSGKSYFAHYYCKKQEKGQMRIIIDSQNYLLTDLSYNSFSGYENKGVVFALCKWFILNNLADAIICKHPKKKWIPLTKIKRLFEFKKQYNDDKLYKIIKGSYETSISSEVGVGKSNNITDVTENSIQGALSNQNTVAYEMVPKQFFEIISTLERYVIEAISLEDDISLVFDNLDELDKRLVDNPTDNDIILNLIKVTREYTNLFIDKKRKVRIILLLRTDVLNKLQVFDGNLSKIKKSCGIELYWLTVDKTAPEEHPLIKMLLHKIKVKNATAAIMTDRDLFNSLFPETIDNKTPLEHLLSYSCGRPRDIIVYLNHVIEQYGNKNAFYALDLKEMRKSYASDFYDELLNQSSFHKEPAFINESLKLISSVKRPTFTYELLESYYTTNKSYYPNIIELKEAVEFLYEMGAIGNSWIKNEKTCTAWSYRKDSMQTIDFSLRLTIHYALRKKFSL